MYTTLSRQKRSRPSTNSTPICLASSECSKYAEFATPGVRTTTFGSASLNAADARKARSRWVE